VSLLENVHRIKVLVFDVEIPFLECQVASHSDEVNCNVHETTFNDVSRIIRKPPINLLISLKKMPVETSRDVEDIAILYL